MRVARHTVNISDSPDKLSSVLGFSGQVLRSDSGSPGRR